jgi:hypothetical protein
MIFTFTQRYMNCAICGGVIGRQILTRDFVQPISPFSETPVRMVIDDEVEWVHEECRDQYIAGPEPHHNED